MIGLFEKVFSSGAFDTLHVIDATCEVELVPTPFFKEPRLPPLFPYGHHD